MEGKVFNQILVLEVDLEQTFNLLNGIKLNDPQTGHHNLNLPISPELIERIEISTGGSTRIYGNYAYCGVINIITKTKVSNL